MAALSSASVSDVTISARFLLASSKSVWKSLSSHFNLQPVYITHWNGLGTLYIGMDWVNEVNCEHWNGIGTLNNGVD